MSKFGRINAEIQAAIIFYCTRVLLIDGNYSTALNQAADFWDQNESEILDKVHAEISRLQESNEGEEASE